nr:MFS transporter [uncultured Brevundimonas sp.]
MIDQTTPAAAGKSASRFGGLAVYGERRVFIMLLLGFSAGLPNLLIFDTLSAWLRESGQTLEVIGFFALATLSYSLKFVWAPLIDRTAVPGLTRLLGHRRAWMLVTQGVIVFGLWSISTLNPSNALIAVAGFAALVGFFGATQDIVIDAWRIEAADDSRHGAMAAAYQMGYRVAMIVAGAVPLVLADLYNWNLSYAVMAALMAFGIAGVLFAPREKAHKIRPIPVGDVPSRPKLEVVEWIVRLAVIGIAAMFLGAGLTGQSAPLNALFGLFGLGADGKASVAAALSAKPEGVYLQFGLVLIGLVVMVMACWPLPGVRTRPGAYLAGSFGQPLADFYRRFSGVATLILALICVYRLADFVLNIMPPFYLDLGFSKTELAEVRKVFGVIMTTVGVFVGGWSVARLGLIRTMVIGAFMSPASNLVFAWLATQGHSLPALTVAIGVDNVSSGYAGTALIAYMSSLTSIGFTATQYALFTSLYALPGKLIASQSGRIVEASARAAEGNGPFAGLRGPFANLQEGVLTAGAATSGVSPAALGAGYVAFFLYSFAIGLFGIVLAFVVAGKQIALQKRRESEAAEDPAVAATEGQPS